MRGGKRIIMIDKNKLIEIFFIKMKVDLVSPCILGGGDDLNSDIDFLRDYEGIPFIPGSSIAGALRAYAADFLSIEENTIQLLFGKNDNYTQSAIFVSDAYFTHNFSIDIRDGVELGNYKSVLNKYDYEVVLPNTALEIKLEIQIREKYRYASEGIKDILYKIIKGFMREDIKIGAKTNRGFGSLKLDEDNIHILHIDFTKDDILLDSISKWIDFDWESFKPNLGFAELMSSDFHANNVFTILRLRLNIPYSILIRSYSTQPELYDYEHINRAGVPVIPGTSWTGPIRNNLQRILEGLGVKGKEIVDLVFGYSDKNTKLASSSLVQVEESVIVNSKAIKLNRIRIDRFTGGTANRGLFTEIPQYGGSVDLVIKIKRNNRITNEVIIGLLILALKDLTNGILPVGGETSIGRGILLHSKDISIIEPNQDSGGKNISQAEEQYYIGMAVDFLRKGGFIIA